MIPRQDNYESDKLQTVFSGISMYVLRELEVESRILTGNFVDTSALESSIQRHPSSARDVEMLTTTDAEPSEVVVALDDYRN